MAKELRQYRMHFELVPEGEPAVDQDALGLRSKLGGRPTWEQEDETPTCPHCGDEMLFVGQIDSIEDDSADNPHRIDSLSSAQQYMFGDVGLIYVFFCEECCEAAAVCQCG
jgi:hypothetical protein